MFELFANTSPHCCIQVEHLRKAAEQVGMAAVGMFTHPEEISMAKQAARVSGKKKKNKQTKPKPRILKRIKSNIKVQRFCFL